MIPKLNIARSSLRLALEADLPLWKPEAWQAVAALINVAMALDPENPGVSSRDRVLRAALKPPRVSGDTANFAQWLRRAAEKAAARTNRPDLAAQLRADEAVRMAPPLPRFFS